MIPFGQGQRATPRNSAPLHFPQSPAVSTVLLRGRTLGQRVAMLLVLMLALPHLLGCAALSAPKPSVRRPVDFCQATPAPYNLEPADVRALVGQPLAGALAQRVVRAWGGGKRVVNFSGSWLAFPERGTRMLLADDYSGVPGTIMAVEFLAQRSAKKTPYNRWVYPRKRCKADHPPKLLGGLRFGMRFAEVNRQLGANPSRPCTSMSTGACHYSEHGLMVRFRNQRVSGVSHSETIGANTIRIDVLSVKPARQRHVNGLMVRFRDRKGDLPAGEYQYGVTASVGGVAVAARPETKRFRTSEGLAKGAPQSGGVFLPYWAMDLPAGQHKLELTLTAQFKAYKGMFKPRGKAKAVRTVGHDRTTLEITMPERSEVRVSVKRLHLKPGEYDDLETAHIAAAVVTGGATALIVPPRHWKKPDPQWCVRLGGEKHYCSISRPDVRKASWRGYTKVLPLCEGDQLELNIGDKDPGRVENLHTFVLSASEWQAAARANRPLSGGRVQKLWLGRVRQKTRRAN